MQPIEWQSGSFFSFLWYWNFGYFFPKEENVVEFTVEFTIVNVRISQKLCWIFPSFLFKNDNLQEKISDHSIGWENMAWEIQVLPHIMTWVLGFWVFLYHLSFCHAAEQLNWVIYHSNSSSASYINFFKLSRRSKVQLVEAEFSLVMHNNNVKHTLLSIWPLAGISTIEGISRNMFLVKGNV